MRTIRFLTGPGRAQLVARLELQMDAIRRPDLRRLMDQAQGQIVDCAGGSSPELGSSHPDWDTALLMTLVDGLLIAELKGATSDDELRRRVRLMFDAAVP